MNGLGKVRYLDGRMLIGEFSDDKLHGLGKHVYPDGRVLEGVFIDGKPCDQVPDRYEGQTVNGQKCGRGKLFKADGSIEDGLWHKDKLVKVYHEPPN